MNPDQFYIFLVCCMLGIAGGALYEFFFLLRTVFRATWVRCLGDGVFCLLFGGAYLFVSVMLGFPNVRLYAIAACMLGFFLYEKSFHKIVAFCAQRVYNMFKQRKRSGAVWKRGPLRRKKQIGSR